MKRGEIKSKILIFDFDGTIADTKSVYYKAIFEELKDYGFSYEQVDKAIDIGLSIKNMLRKLGFGFLAVFFVKKAIMKKVLIHVNKVRKCRDVDSIKKIDCRKILITNSLKEFALPILKHLKLNCFSEIYGADDFDDKTEFIKNYLKQNKIDKKNCFYIGDRAADVKLARNAGIKSIAISGKCSWDSKKEVLEQKPDFVVDDIKNLSKIFECAQKCEHQ